MNQWMMNELVDDEFAKLCATINLSRKSDKHDTDYWKLPGVDL